MRKPFAQLAGSVAVICLLSAPALGQFVYRVNPTPFAQAQPIVPTMPVPNENSIKAPLVRTPLGTIVGAYLRSELHDGDLPVGIVTLRDFNRTVAVPLEHLRFDPAHGDVVTDLSWNEIATMPSGIRSRDSRCHPFGCPTTG